MQTSLLALSKNLGRLAIAAALLVPAAACQSVEGAGLEGFTPAVRRGELFARQNCAQCHALGLSMTSSDPSAPPFKRIRMNYNSLSLQRELEAIPEVGHYLMRPIMIEPGDVEDLIAYIESLD